MAEDAKSIENIAITRAVSMALQDHWLRSRYFKQQILSLIPSYELREPPTSEDIDRMANRLMERMKTDKPDEYAALLKQLKMQ